MKNLQNKTIGVFFGGQNPEHEISIITGEFIIAELRKMDLKVVAVYVDKTGVWYSNEKISELKFFQKDYTKKLRGLSSCCLDLTSSKNKLVLQHNKFLSKKKIDIDFVFPAFHGLYGEDGTIQGLAEFFRVPYAGCGIYASSVSIDKGLTKKFLNSLNIPTTNFITSNKHEFVNDEKDLISKIKTTLTFPIFVKPAKTGSSIGITKVKNDVDLKDALALAFHYDTQIVVENSVENIADLTCAVLSDGSEVVISEVQESVFESSDLFDYSVKYLEDGGAQTGNAESNLIIPANISNKQTEQIKEYSRRIFKEIEASGTIRVDFLLNKKTGELFANEINTLPGTLYHHLWKKTGYPINEVLEKMLMHGYVKWKESQEIQNDFKTDVLNNANQLKLQYQSES
ncbi:D-alanine--D-alanine ligase [Patescibacteria group bacterium]|nr:D-alanine--D-alanine ligase [Patescibacteria group bacterium]